MTTKTLGKVKIGNTLIINGNPIVVDNIGHPSGTASERMQFVDDNGVFHADTIVFYDTDGEAFWFGRPMDKSLVQ